jgi:putative spermidine/putrescine transport system substrate-binding protein
VPPKPDRIVVNASGGAMNNIFRRSYFAAFERRHGIRVVDTSPVNFGKLRAMVESGNPEWTVTEIGGQDAMRAKELNLLEPLDLSVIDRSEYPETAKDSHVLASSAYTTALGYRTDVFPNNSHPKGWAEFWDVRRFPGPRSLRNHPADNLEFALLADGVPMDQLYPIDMDRAFRKLDEIRPHITVWWSTGAQPAQLLTDRHRVRRRQPEIRLLRHPARHPPSLLGPALPPDHDGAGAPGRLHDRARLSRPEPPHHRLRAHRAASAAVYGARQRRASVLA